jgi:hypothetical protein
VILLLLVLGWTNGAVVFDVKSIEYFSTGSGTDSSVFTPWLAISEAKGNAEVGVRGVADGKNLSFVVSDMWNQHQ